MKNLIASILIVASIVIAYLCFLSIMAPIKFDKERQVRETAIKSRLIDIKKIQEQFQADNKRYIGDIDSLAEYAKTAQVKIIIKSGNLTEAQLDKGMTEAEGVKKGFLIRDTTRISFIDSVLKPNYDIDSIAYVPVPEANGAKFIMGTNYVETLSKVELPVFEAKVPFETYLMGMDKQTIINLNDDAETYKKYNGLKIGDLNVANNNAGNWE